MGIGIELMNEPRVSDDGFTLEYLKSFYAIATEVVQTATQGGIQIVVHGTQLSFNPTNTLLTTCVDAFWVNRLYLHVNQ
jgi:hypothetical protein